MSRFWCWIGLHRWNAALGECEDCECPDTYYDDPMTARDRLAEWKARRR